MLHLYTWLLRILFPVLIIRLGWRGLRNRAYWQRIPERFGFIPRIAAERLIWIHAVSVGEVRAVQPLVKALFDNYPDYAILLTTMTPTGSDQVKKLFNTQVWHCYVPYDFPSAVSRFLDRTRPALSLIMETELWPNIFHMCRKRSIPLLVANMRMSESSMQGYLRFAGFTSSTLRQVNTLAVQSQVDAQRLKKMGASEQALKVIGSIKFEIKLPASLLETAEVLRRDWGQDRPVWIAASTREGEEVHILAAFTDLKIRFPQLLLVLVPRHPERFSPVARACRRKGYKTALRSEQNGPVDKDIEILVGDTMGELQLLYAASDVAFVGGSLVPAGGHNLLEAAAVGVPVVFGPHMFNFDEISMITRERGAGVQVRNARELAETVGDLLGNANRRFETGEAGKRMVNENRGALEKTLALINDYL